LLTTPQLRRKKETEMIRRGKQIVWSSILVCAAAHAQTNLATAQSPVIRTPPVQVFVSISAKDGSAASPALTTLSVLLDRQPAQVVSLQPAKDEKLLFAVIVDDSSSERTRQQSIKDAAIRIFQGLLDDQSHGYLVLVDQTVQPSKRPLQPSEVQATIDKIGFGGGTALFDGIAQTCSQILGRSQNPDTPRRVLILLSDGDDNYSHLTFAKSEEIAEREGVAVFSLAERSSSNQGAATLTQVSKDTGGRDILVNKLSEGIAPLLSAIRGQQSLDILPSQKADQKFHSLVVKTTEKGISVSVPAHIPLP
jgi:Ca-activated chloride channel family protein